MNGLNRGFISTYFLAIVITLFALFIIDRFNISYPLTIANTQKSSEFSIVGEGKVKVVPDTSSVQLSIVVEGAQSANAAQNELNKKNNEVILAIEKFNIDKKDIKTSRYSINPDYKYTEGDSKIDGYTGEATITVKIRQASKVSQIVNAAVDAGANQIGNVQFATDEPSKFREQARTNAIEDAKRQAKNISKQTGIRLGRIVNMIESQGNSDAPLRYAGSTQDSTSLSFKEKPEPEISLGSEEVVSTVTLFFEIK